jgi:HD-like signal output (HDOD) protein
MKQLDPDRISKMVDELPAFPRSVQEVLVLTNDINCAPRDLVRVVEHDPVLTGHMLKLVNSAYFGLSRRIDSVKEAVAFVGLNTLKHLALSVAAVGALPKHNKAGLEMDQFLSHSLAVGAVGRWLAPKLGLGTRDGDHLFLAGLLHEIGYVVLALHVPKAYRAIIARSRERGIPAYQLEQQVLGATHYEIGAMVGLKWELHEKVIEAIRHHWVSPPEVARSVWMDGLFGATWLVRALEKGTTPPELVAAPEMRDEFERRLGYAPAKLLDEREALAQVVAKSQVFKNL